MPHDIPTTNMQRSKKEVKDNDLGCEVACDTPKYPYGLRISLHDESLKKLNITELPPAGEKLRIYADVEVSESASTDNLEGGKSLRMELQITDLALLANTKEESTEEKLYKT